MSQTFTAEQLKKVILEKVTEEGRIAAKYGRYGKADEQATRHGFMVLVGYLSGYYDLEIAAIAAEEYHKAAEAQLAEKVEVNEAETIKHTPDKCPFCGGPLMVGDDFVECVSCGEDPETYPGDDKEPTDAELDEHGQREQIYLDERD